MGLRCGIDLGTTYSSISWFDTFGNRVDTVELVRLAYGGKVLRSVVYYPDGGQPPVVGETAWNCVRQFRDRVIIGIKRSMGTAYKTPPIDSVEYTPQQVSAEILKALVAEAESFLGEQVTDVIITVPAYFGDKERAATEEAGKLAGVNVLGLLPEPHAAALAFAVEKVADIADRYLLVYDLGGGTFDITLIHARTETDPNGQIHLRIDTLCKDGNAARGGLDWDAALAGIVAEKIQQQHGIAIPQDDPVLLDNCEKAKRHLSVHDTVSILGDAAGHQVDVTVAELEDRTRDLLLETQILVEKVVDDAEKLHGITKDKIDLMLTGGSSKMPMVEKMAETVMGKKPLHYRNPELLVTIGAAYWAHLLEAENTVPVVVKGPDGQPVKKDVQVDPGGLTDLSLYAVGVEVLRPDGQGGVGKFNAVVVPAGASYEQTFEKRFRKSEDDMTEILVALYKGDSPDLSQCQPLKTFTIVDLPAGGKKDEEVLVKMGYDRSGILRGEAKDLTTGKAVDIVVDWAPPAPVRPGL